MAKKDELQLDRPRDFVQRERSAQRAGVIALTLFVAAGAAGAFGEGPLSRTRTEGGIEVEYQRFARITALTWLMISVATPLPDGAPVRIRIERRFLQDVGDLETRPPDALRDLDETTAFFEVSAIGGRGHFELQYAPHRFGIFDLTIAAEHVEPVHIRQFVYF